mmetsp:Transcript_1097/g.980  ORF Transcript_1097/g.980 Transcript_1097/m.980 type:complete len:104 (+) Transcript_1097:1516-1827(+)
MGRPEMQGKVDTITTGSQNNSLMLLNKGGDSSKEGSLSGFAKKGGLSDQKKSGQASSFKGGSDLYKKTMLKNMARNSSEEAKEDPNSPSKERRFSDFAPKTTS